MDLLAIQLLAHAGDVIGANPHPDPVGLMNSHLGQHPGRRAMATISSSPRSRLGTSA